MPGYREETGVDPLSRTETYAAMRLDVDNWRWAGVPFYVRTGKRLPRRVTEVVLQFQRPPHLPIRADQVTELQPDALILRIQPDEGITLRFGAKVPGHSFRVRTAIMEFSYEETFREESPEAYERLLLDALIGDPTLFIRSDEVEQAGGSSTRSCAHWAGQPGPDPVLRGGVLGADRGRPAAGPRRPRLAQVDRGHGPAQRAGDFGRGRRARMAAGARRPAHERRGGFAGAGRRGGRDPRGGGRRRAPPGPATGPGPRHHPPTGGRSRPGRRIWRYG